MTWVNVSIPATTGNASVFVAADPIVVERSGNDADEIDFNNTFSSGAPWVFTSVDPIIFTATNRNDPA